MFKKSRIKIVAAIMSVLILLFAGTLVVIYTFSYSEVTRRDLEMLRRYADAYWVNGNPAGTTEENPPPAPEDPSEDRTYRLTDFHSAAFSDSGEVISIDNDSDSGLTDDRLETLARQLILSPKSSGVSGSWIYYTETSQDITLVVLMDNTILSGNIGTLLYYTLLFGSISIFLLFLAAFYLARRIVQPLEDNYQKQKQFISDAGHELKTPLAVISANAELLERAYGSSRWLDNIKSENRRMTDLVRQLLELARTETLEAPMERVDLSRIVTGGILPFESIAFERARILCTDISDSVFVRGNTEQLGNLVSILVDNALDYAPENSVITVTLTEEHGKALLSVSNESEPIPPQQRKYLFDRFYRADPARNGESRHYGLGLAIARAITVSHHGKIDVICRQDLVTFCVSLPVSNS